LYGKQRAIRRSLASGDRSISDPVWCVRSLPKF
jgi:hypothetical protein